MKSILKTGMLLCFAAAMSYAANWNGKLLDASCSDKNASTTQLDKKAQEKLAQTCAATASTTNFAVLTSEGKIYKLDSAGDTKAASELKSGTLKPDKDGDIHVSVSGNMKGDTVDVDTISAGKSRG
jgi:uncharacterized protein YaeQ